MDQGPVLRHQSNRIPQMGLVIWLVRRGDRRQETQHDEPRELIGWGLARAPNPVAEVKALSEVSLRAVPAPLIRPNGSETYARKAAGLHRLLESPETRDVPSEAIRP